MMAPKTKKTKITVGSNGMFRVIEVTRATATALCDALTAHLEATADLPEVKGA